MTARHNPKTKAGSAVKGPWTGAEIAAAISLYQTIRSHVVDHASPMTKAELIRYWRGEQGPLTLLGMSAHHGSLKARSRGSVEAKLMNISACIESMIARRDDGHYDYAAELSLAKHGYKAFGNVQAALADAVREYVIGQRAAA